MTINFTWDIQHWEVSLKPINGFDNVVKTVAWRLIATDADGNSTTAIGRTNLEPPPAGASTFVKKEDLTKDQVIAWLEADPKLNYPAYVKNMTAHLEAHAANLPLSQFEVPKFASGSAPPAAAV